ncbi:MAG TPA: hypothetical protein VK659_22595 [Asanoa sp.]|nr:hypothetical protein [Asanoa sp.]
MDNARIDHPAAGLGDDDLLTELRRVAGDADPAPAQVQQATRSVLITRDLDAELAVLIGDSRAAGFEAVRADQGGWLLSFAGGGIHVDMEVTGSGGPARLVGQVSGVPVSECHLEPAGGSLRPLDLDDLGRFIAEAVPHGPLRLRCRLAGGALVTTAWVTV